MIHIITRQFENCNNKGKLEIKLSKSLTVKINEVFYENKTVVSSCSDLF